MSRYSSESPDIPNIVVPYETPRPESFVMASLLTSAAAITMATFALVFSGKISLERQPPENPQPTESQPQKPAIADPAFAYGVWGQVEAYPNATSALIEQCPDDVAVAQIGGKPQNSVDQAVGKIARGCYVALVAVDSDTKKKFPVGAISRWDGNPFDSLPPGTR